MDNDKQTSKNRKNKRGESTSAEDDIIRYKLTTLLLGVLNICLTVLFVLEIHYMNTSEYYTNMYMAHDIDTICVKCGTVSLGPDYEELVEEFDGEVYQRDGENICCSKNASHIVERAAERKSRLKYSIDDDNETSTPCSDAAPRTISSDGYSSATFTRLSHHHEYNNKTKKPILFWDHHPEYSHIGPNFTYHDGKLHVNDADYYYVYCSIAYWQISSKMKQTFQTRGFSHWVFKNNANHGDNDEKLVIENTDMMCESETGITTSHAGSVLYMEAGEYLYVKVSEASRLARESLGNAFGIFKI